MQVLDEGRVVVLERSIVKSNYSSFAPLPYENAPLHPYQASRDTDEHQNGHKKRKRSAYAPNQRELDFNARHAAVEPLLSSALLSLRTWMNTANSSTIPEALGISAPPSPAKIEKKERIDSPPPPDYIALSEMRRVTNPKFIWQDDIQEEQKEEEYDLFDHLISNDSNAERVGFAFSHQVIIPPRAAFFLSDFHSLSRSKLLQTHKHCFQCIILDPPWENRSVKRSSAYEMLPNKQLLGLPVSSFAAPGGCLVALWVTNREKLRVFIEEELLEAWGLRHVATWHWLKVAEDGQPLFPLDCVHSRPYESLLLCCLKTANGNGEPPPPPDGKVIIAVPTEHSRKPYIGALLQEYLPAGSMCLEMFAREMQPGVVSWGNEVLKFQGGENFVRNVSGKLV